MESPCNTRAHEKTVYCPGSCAFDILCSKYFHKIPHFDCGLSSENKIRVLSIE